MKLTEKFHIDNREQAQDQVASAMESIKQASQQNLTGTKQAEAAAQNLHKLGERLKELVEEHKA